MFWPVARFVVAVPALIAIALQQSNTWHDPSVTWKTIPFLAIAFVGAVEPLVNGIRDRRSTSRVARETALREMLGERLAQIERLTAIPCADLGISMYRVGRRRPRGERRLHRVVRLRLAPQPASNVAWCIGKGVVGLCALRQTDLTLDVFGLHDPYRSPAEWARLGSDVTLGLTWEECQLLRGKHGYIVATPINDPSSGRVVGVVTIDGPPQASAALDSGPVQDVVRQAAPAVGRELTHRLR